MEQRSAIRNVHESATAAAESEKLRKRSVYTGEGTWNMAIERLMCRLVRSVWGMLRPMLSACITIISIISIVVVAVIVQGVLPLVYTAVRTRQPPLIQHSQGESRFYTNVRTSARFRPSESHNKHNRMNLEDCITAAY